jgi:hypothetical protein
VKERLEYWRGLFEEAERQKRGEGGLAE